MGTIDGKAPASRKGAERNGPPPAPPAPRVDLADIARIRREARIDGEAEGRTAGLAEGRQVGHTEGLATGLAAASVHAERLRALAQSLPDALRRAEEELSARRARARARRGAPGGAPHAEGRARMGAARWCATCSTPSPRCAASRACC